MLFRCAYSYQLNTPFRYSAHRNLIGLGYDIGNPSADDVYWQLYIPEGYWNTTQFRATLGHKVNHSFNKARTAYNFATHPRFGWIRAVIALENVYKESKFEFTK